MFKGGSRSYFYGIGKAGPRWVIKEGPHINRCGSWACARSFPFRRVFRMPANTGHHNPIQPQEHSSESAADIISPRSPRSNRRPGQTSFLYL